MHFCFEITASTLPKDKSSSSKKKTSSLKCRPALQARVLQKASVEALYQKTRAASLGGGKSIKEVLKKDPRYLSPDVIRRTSSGT